jgi:hypothetical protein
MRFERDEEGRDDDCVEVGTFWEESSAVAEQDRLAALEANPAVHYEVVATEATVVYPDDESSPWVSDPDRWKKRGYERPSTE